MMSFAVVTASEMFSSNQVPQHTLTKMHLCLRWKKKKKMMTPFGKKWRHTRTPRATTKSSGMKRVPATRYCNLRERTKL